MNRDIDINQPQVERNTITRVALAAATLAAILAIAKRKEISPQVTAAITALPDFYQMMKRAPQNAHVTVLETPFPKEAEAYFSLLSDDKGSERFSLTPSMVSFMDPDRIILAAEASKSKIPGVHVVQLQEDFALPHAPRSRTMESPLTYVISLTGRNLSFVHGRR